MKTEKECYYDSTSSIVASSLNHPCPPLLSEFNVDNELPSFGSMILEPSLQTLAPLPSSLLPAPTFGFDNGECYYHPVVTDAHHDQLGGDGLYSESHELCPLSFYSGFVAATESNWLEKSTMMSPESLCHLPDLESLEQIQPNQLATPSSPLIHHLKRRRGSDDSDPQPFQVPDSFVRSSFVVSQSKQSPENSSSPAYARCDLARLRRQKIGDKTRSLQKLMPWDKKMDMTTLLEEAFKYVKFLQAQVETLQWMPLESSFSTGGRNAGGGAFGLLARLNRQQLLQVLVNSQAAQTMLYSQGLCVFSYEQLISLKKLTQRKAALPQPQASSGGISELGGE